MSKKSKASLQPEIFQRLLSARRIARYTLAMNTREAIRAELVKYERRMAIRIATMLVAAVAIILSVLPALLN